MKKEFVLSIITVTTVFLVQCNSSTTDLPVSKENFGGYESQAKWGEHLVTVSGCQDCHSPKKMTPMGPAIDTATQFAGHLAGAPDPQINRKELQEKGLAVTSDETVWVGPWGISYARNISSDSTGIGNWKEEQFMLALREGKFKGLKDGRGLLPPMPWEAYKNFTDGELKAIFAFLKTTKPIKNVVPEAAPPADK